jgi:hypothetical protein
VTFINTIGEALKVSNEVYGRRSRKNFADLSEVNKLRCWLERRGIQNGWTQGYDGYKGKASAVRSAWGFRNFFDLRREGTVYKEDVRDYWKWVEQNFPEVVTYGIENPYTNIKHDRIDGSALIVKIAERLLEISRGLPEGLI